MPAFDDFNRNPDRDDREPPPPESIPPEANPPEVTSPEPIPPGEHVESRTQNAPRNPPPALSHSTIRCPNRDYNLTGTAIGGTCPECGLIDGRGVLASTHQPVAGKAVAALVLGIVSIVGCGFYGVPSIVCGPLAIGFAQAAKRQVRREEAGPNTLGMATAGLVCGIIGSVLGGVALLGLIVFIAAIVLSS